MSTNCQTSTTGYSCPAGQRSWYAVYTRFKCEKQVKKSLESKGITAYVPLCERVRKYGARRRVSHIPLIHCYVFVNVRPDDCIKVLKTPNVQGFPGRGNKPVPIPEREIDWLRRLAGEVSELDTVEQDYCEGMEVEIVSGPLCGIQGKLINKNGKNSFVVELSAIGCKLRMAINTGILKAI